MPEPTPDVHPPEFEALREKGRLQEQPFTSGAPLFGGLIARFRAAWNSVSTKWYVRPMMTQQTEFNLMVADYLEESVRPAREALPVLEELDRRLLALDQEQTRLTHDLGELGGQIAQLNRKLAALEERLEGPQPPAL